MSNIIRGSWDARGSGYDIGLMYGRGSAGGGGDVGEGVWGCGNSGGGSTYQALMTWLESWREGVKGSTFNGYLIGKGYCQY